MGVETKSLVPSKYAENSQTTQYTAPSATNAVVQQFTITNNGGSAATLSINIMPPSTAAATENRITVTRSVPSGKTITVSEMLGQALQAGEAISTIASAASTLTIRVSGIEIS